MTTEQIIDQIKNREREFRVWDEENRKMYYWPDHEAFVWASCFSGQMVAIGGDGAHVEDMVTRLDFTGQRDLNGKKIFEGDILEWTHAALPKDEFTRGIVTYDADGCGYVVRYDVDGSCKQSLQYIGYLSVVAGNIFENPELMEAL